MTSIEATDHDFRRLPQSGRGIMRKRDLLARIYKHKQDLYDEVYAQTGDWSEGAHHMLNKMLELAQEYGD